MRSSNRELLRPARQRDGGLIIRIVAQRLADGVVELSRLGIIALRSSPDLPWTPDDDSVAASAGEIENRDAKLGMSVGRESHGAFSPAVEQATRGCVGAEHPEFAAIARPVYRRHHAAVLR